jgi:hypothetical protein
LGYQALSSADYFSPVRIDVKLGGEAVDRAKFEARQKVRHFPSLVKQPYSFRDNILPWICDGSVPLRGQVHDEPILEEAWMSKT